MGPEESDCQGSCLILYACNQSVVVALDVEHSSAALDNAGRLPKPTVSWSLSGCDLPRRLEPVVVLSSGSRHRLSVANCSWDQAKRLRRQDEVTQIERDDTVRSAVHMLPTRWPVLQLLKQRRRRPVEVAKGPVTIDHNTSGSM